LENSHLIMFQVEEEEQLDSLLDQT